MLILTERLRSHMDDEQAGFRQDRSTVQHILALRLIAEKKVDLKTRKYTIALLTFKMYLTALIGQ
jgi:hypothetical protein